MLVLVLGVTALLPGAVCRSMLTREQIVQYVGECTVVVVVAVVVMARYNASTLVTDLMYCEEIAATSAQW